MTGPSVKIIIGDAMEKLRELSSDSVHCVITSPPYFALRRYSRCQCAQAKSALVERNSALNCGARTPRYSRAPDPNCPLCHGTGEIAGVKEKEIGVEETPDAYVGRLVEVFREVRRVLRSDGVFWLNMGDSYAGSWGNFGHRPDLDGIEGGYRDPRNKESDYYYRRGWDNHRGVPANMKAGGIPSKNLIGIPWRVALAMQADGWILRSDVIFAKRGCMPESVIDRCSRNHEYFFMLAKSNEPQFWTHRDKDGTHVEPEPDYRWINDITKEEFTERPSEFDDTAAPCPDCEGTGEIDSPLELDEPLICGKCNGSGEVRRWHRINLWKGHDYYYDADAIREPFTFNRWSPSNTMGSSNKPVKPTAPGQSPSSFQRVGHSGYFRKDGSPAFNPLGRNKRTVWTITSEPSSEPHSATFPKGLVTDPIKACTPEKGCCPKCGAPYTRIIVKVRPEEWEDQGVKTDKEIQQRDMAKTIYGGNQKSRSISDIFSRALQSGVKQLGWRATCECNAGDPIPATVLDMFAGSGTTGQVARELGRSSILIDLNPVYERIMRKRTMADIPAVESFGADSQ